MEQASEKEISLRQICDFSHRYWKRILLVTIAGGAIGIVAATFLPKQWEASADLQVGQIQFSADGGPTLVEPLAQVVARVQNRAFVDDVVQAMHWETDDGFMGRATLVRRSLSAKPLPATQLVAMTVRGYSRNDAMATLTQVESQLIAAHARTVDSALGQIKSQLAEVNQVLASRQSAVNRMEQKITGGGGSTQSAPDALVIGSIALSKLSSEDLLKLKLSLEQQASPERTFNSKNLTRITSLRQAVFPRRSLFAAAGLVVGLLLGLGLALLKELGRLARGEVTTAK